MTTTDEAFVDSEIHTYVIRGVITEWRQNQPPHLVLPIFVDRSRTKPRLIWDGTFINMWMRHNPFTLNPMSVIQLLAIPNVAQIVMDHKSGYHHIGIEHESRKYFGLRWRNKYYTFAGGLPFGWSPAPYVYQRFSDGIAQYLRTRFSLAASMYIDDMWCTSWSAGHLRQLGVLGPHEQRLDYPRKCRKRWPVQPGTLHSALS